MGQLDEPAQLTVLEASRCASGNHQCDTCAVREQAFCAALNDREIGDLARISLHKTYAPGEVIFDEDSQPGRFANIVSGTVKLLKLLPDGRQQIIGFLFSGDFIGHIYGDCRSNCPVNNGVQPYCFTALAAPHPSAQS